MTEASLLATYTLQLATDDRREFMSFQDLTSLLTRLGKIEGILFF